MLAAYDSNNLRASDNNHYELWFEQNFDFIADSMNIDFNIYKMYVAMLAHLRKIV